MIADAIVAIVKRRSPDGRARTARSAPWGTRDRGRLTRQLPAWYGRGWSRRRRDWSVCRQRRTRHL